MSDQNVPILPAEPEDDEPWEPREGDYFTGIGPNTYRQITDIEGELTAEELERLRELEGGDD